MNTNHYIHHLTSYMMNIMICDVQLNTNHYDEYNDLYLTAHHNDL